MNRQICYIPTVNCSQLGVYTNHDTAKIKAIEALVNLNINNELEFDLGRLIKQIIETDNTEDDLVWIEQMFLYK